MICKQTFDLHVILANIIARFICIMYISIDEWWIGTASL